MSDGISINPMNHQPVPQDTYSFVPVEDITVIELAAIIARLGVMGINQSGFDALSHVKITEQTDSGEFIRDVCPTRHYQQDPKKPVIQIPTNGNPII